MRDLAVSYKKIMDDFGFRAKFTVDDGIREVLNALQNGLIQDPTNLKYRNAQFIVQ